MVTISLLAVLMALAMPPMLDWVRDSRVRAVAEALQSGLREAQSEALRRSRQVVFALTDDKPTAASTDITAKANGSQWASYALPSMSASEDPAFIAAGVLSELGAGVQVSGPAALCFNSVGRRVANDKGALIAVTGGATCAVADETTYTVSQSGGLSLQVRVALGGQVRMCDTRKTLSNTHPDGCPAATP